MIATEIKRTLGDYYEQLDVNKLDKWTHEEIPRIWQPNQDWESWRNRKSE